MFGYSHFTRTKDKGLAEVRVEYMRNKIKQWIKENTKENNCERD